MKTLAFDSTAKTASVAVAEDGKLLAEYNIDNGLTQSELLLPMAEDVLKSLKLSFSDIELIACSVGPGSFTGVRIGVSLVKGIAFARNLPCCEVSTLEALAQNLSGLSGIIVPVMDARRAQVYTATFECRENEIKRLTEDRLIPITELAEKLAKYGESAIYLVGDGYDLAKSKLGELGVKTENTPVLLRSENAFSIAKIAYEKYGRGEFCTDRDMKPVYLRLPQAQRERLEKLKSESENNT